jgi:hypothetical protein
MVMGETRTVCGIDVRMVPKNGLLSGENCKVTCEFCEKRLNTLAEDVEKLIYENDLSRYQ